MEKDYLIEKWLKEELSESEMEAFDAMDDAEFNKAIIEDAQLFKASNFSTPHEFEKLEKRLNGDNKVHSLNVGKMLLRVASVVVISLGFYYTFFNNPMTTVNSMASETKSIRLPDNSEVTLNALSEIIYSEKNWQKERNISLDGEAFFDVEKGQQFEVLTSQGTVTVLGTEFTVKQRKNYFEVVCYEGRVKVISKAATKELTPGETFKIINNILMEGTTISAKPSWLENMSSFKSVPYQHVLNELERQYGVEITYEGSQNNKLFTGSFVNDNLENALNSITQPLVQTYKITSNQVLITDE